MQNSNSAPAAILAKEPDDRFAKGVRAVQHLRAIEIKDNASFGASRSSLSNFFRD